MGIRHGTISADNRSRGVVVQIDGNSLTLESVKDVARGAVKVALSTDPRVLEKIEKSVELRDSLIDSGAPIYGVTTGVGASVDRQVARDRAAEMQHNLVRKCGCGSGPTLPVDETRAAILIRANCLAKGNSGVRRVLIDRLLDLLNLDLLPLIPEQGSLGASGDLVPGSYIAAALVGERDLVHDGQIIAADEAWAQHGRESIRFEPKEGLSIINGTMVMSGIGVLAALDAERLARAADVCGAMALEGLAGIPSPYDPFLQRVKPYPGVDRSAGFMLHLLEGSQLARRYQKVVDELEPMGASGYRQLEVRIQDHYSIRCAPHCTGALYDTLDWARRWLEIEINSSNDNPLFEIETACARSGGNFSGFHVGMAMDSLKIAVASVADQLDRQFALLVDERFSNGLPGNLSPVRSEDDPEHGIHHGFKGVQLAMSALAAEAQQRAMPMTVFSRSTEWHNQDKVSMATTAARQGRDIVEIAERCVAMHLLACCQAADLRGAERLGRTRSVYERIRGVSARVDRDRELQEDIGNVTELLRSGELLEGLEE
jgi:histidine ammonia-lyase/phenylalanine ammonia-lyase